MQSVHFSACVEPAIRAMLPSWGMSTLWPPCEQHPFQSYGGFRQISSVINLGSNQVGAEYKAAAIG